MKITVKQFVDMLKHSTLDKEQRLILLDALKDLSPEAIEGISDALKLNSENVKSVVKEVDTKQKARIVQMLDEIKDIEVKEE